MKINVWTTAIVVFGVLSFTEAKHENCVHKSERCSVKKTKWPMKWFTKFSHPDHHNVQWCENGEWQTKYWCHKSGKQEPIDECLYRPIKHCVKEFPGCHLIRKAECESVVNKNASGLWKL